MVRCLSLNLPGLTWGSINPANSYMLSDKQGAINMAKTPVGRYRCPAVGNLEETAYVEDGGIASFVKRSDYEAKGYSPPFDQLPTEDQYIASKKAK